MRKRSLILPVSGLLVAILLLLLVFPVTTSATNTTGVLIAGYVTLNWHSLSPQDNATVTATIAGVSNEWSRPVTIVNGQSLYSQLLIPMNTGSGAKDGGENGDVIHFMVMINGVTYLDNLTEIWVQGKYNLWHSVNVNDSQISSLAITTDSLAAGRVGVTYSQLLAASGGSQPYAWSWTTASGQAGLPPGLGLSTDGITSITGMPTLSGNYTVTIKVKDAMQVSVSKDFLLVVSNPQLSITTDSLAAGMVGVSYSQPLAATGGIQPYAWSWTTASGPAGLPPGLDLSTINATTSISGTPTLSGNYTVTVTVKDALQFSASKDFILAVSKIQDGLMVTTTELPRWVTDPPSTEQPPGWIAGLLYSANLTATGGFGDYHWIASGLPHPLVLSENGTLAGTPDTPGTYIITFAVTDSASPAHANSKQLSLKIYMRGDANGDGKVNSGDIAYDESAILMLVPPTAGCDADEDGKIDVADVTEISQIILHPSV